MTRPYCNLRWSAFEIAGLLCRDERGSGRARGPATQATGSPATARLRQRPPPVRAPATSHPEEPVLDQRPADSPVQEHRAEEAAHDEKERHPEAVNGGDDEPETGILLTICDDPERRE